MLIARKNKPAPESVARLHDLVKNSLEDDKSLDIVSIDLEGKTSFADFMLIATGRSDRHVGAIARHLMERIKAAGLGSCKVEGMPKNDWVLVDAGDIVVHVFRPDVREFYNLEKMWAMDLSDFHQGGQAAI